MVTKAPWSGEQINAHQKLTKFTAQARHPVADPKLMTQIRTRGKAGGTKAEQTHSTAVGELSQH